jgi:hypothetical protein
MKNEAVKQDIAYVARDYVGSLFCLAVCGDPVSAKLRLCRTGIYRRRGSDVDHAQVQRHLKYSVGAVRVTLRCHPKRQANAFSSSGIITNVISEIKTSTQIFGCRS